MVKVSDTLKVSDNSGFKQLAFLMKLSNIISFPIMMVGLYYLYMAFEHGGGEFAWYLVACVLILAVIYIFSPQIDWWYFKRNPPRLPAPVHHLLNSKYEFYQNLPADGKTVFRNRMALYKEANEFMPQGMEEVPLDIQFVAAASAVTLTMGQEDFLLNKFEHIIVYPHPFPSPQYPEHWHTSEYFEEDGVIMFSAEHLMKGFLEAKKYFHTGLYEYARIYRNSYPDKNYPEFEPDIWEKIKTVSNFDKEAIEKWVGLPETDVYAVCTVLFFVFPKKMKAVLPNIYEALNQIFNAPFG